MASVKQKITTCLWFDQQAEEAANFYVSLFQNSKVNSISRYGEEASKAAGMPKNAVMTATFTLDGQHYMALNGGPIFKFTEAVSFMVNCDTQSEIDFFWEKLTADGGQPSRCGWLKDKFGLSWQIIPSDLEELMTGPKAKEVMHVVLQCDKLDINKMRAAAGKV
jgi:predicted 3-demethylubiquinone-9 3-methyltransferase (glyoxalase superfamily)